MLIQSGRLDEASINPAAFVDACATIINAGKRLVMVNGIRYEKLDECYFAPGAVRARGGCERGTHGGSHEVTR